MLWSGHWRLQYRKGLIKLLKLLCYTLGMLFGMLLSHYVPFSSTNNDKAVLYSFSSCSLALALAMTTKLLSFLLCHSCQSLSTSSPPYPLQYGFSNFNESYEQTVWDPAVHTRHTCRSGLNLQLSSLYSV